MAIRLNRKEALDPQKALSVLFFRDKKSERHCSLEPPYRPFPHLLWQSSNTASHGSLARAITPIAVIHSVL